MKTALMIAPYFIPRRRVGALRPFKFAIHLHSYGYQPVILTISSKENKYTEREKELLNDIKIIEIEPPFDRTTYAKKSLKNKSKNNYLLDWLDKQTPLDSWIYLFLYRYYGIMKEVRRIDPDIIWATGDPWSGLWLGEKVSRSLSKPLVADFRDPWTVSKINLRNRSPISMDIDKKMEKRIIENADKVIFTSNLTKKKYVHKYHFIEKKAHTIYNSFDSTLIQENKSEQWDERLNDGYLNILFFGRFRHLSPSTPIVKALKELKNEYPEIANYIHIHSFGQPDEKDLKRIQESGLEYNFVTHDPVLPEKMLQVLRSADILLLSTNMDREEVIPAKLWDYLAVHVPILSIVPNPEVGEIIMKNKAGIQVHPSEKLEIAELLRSFANAKHNNESLLLTPEKEIPDRNQLEAKQRAGELASLFDELV